MPSCNLLPSRFAWTDGSGKEIQRIAKISECGDWETVGNMLVAATPGLCTRGNCLGVSMANEDLGGHVIDDTSTLVAMMPSDL